jgi:hypothetical protein
METPILFSSVTRHVPHFMPLTRGGTFMNMLHELGGRHLFVGGLNKIIFKLEKIIKNQLQYLVKKKKEKVKVDNLKYVIFF